MSIKVAVTRQVLMAMCMKHWRTERGLSQSDLAKMAGVTGSSYSRYESGDTPIPALALNRVLKGMKKNQSEFWLAVEAAEEMAAVAGIIVVDDMGEIGGRVVFLTADRQEFFRACVA